MRAFVQTKLIENAIRRPYKIERSIVELHSLVYLSRFFMPFTKFLQTSLRRLLSHDCWWNHVFLRAVFQAFSATFFVSNIVVMLGPLTSLFLSFFILVGVLFIRVLLPRGSYRRHGKKQRRDPDTRNESEGDKST